MADSPNVAVVRAAFVAFSRRDEQALLTLAHPGIRFHAPTGALTRAGEPYVGHEGLRAYLRDVAALWSELRVEPRDFREGGDVVVALGRVYAWGAGRVVDAPVGWVWRLRDGRLVDGRVFDTQRAALEHGGFGAGQAP
jgi:ketosteroid isomerase-like protein